MNCLMGIERCQEKFPSKIACGGAGDLSSAIAPIYPKKFYRGFD